MIHTDELRPLCAAIVLRAYRDLAIPEWHDDAAWFLRSEWGRRIVHQCLPPRKLEPLLDMNPEQLHDWRMRHDHLYRGHQ